MRLREIQRGWEMTGEGWKWLGNDGIRMEVVGRGWMRHTVNNCKRFPGFIFNSKGLIPSQKGMSNPVRIHD